MVISGKLKRIFLLKTGIFYTFMLPKLKRIKTKNHENFIQLA
jgi:hypothetical protein